MDRSILLSSLLFVACGGSCPEPTTPATGRSLLHAEVEAPESLSVSLDGLSGELDVRHVFNGFGCTGENHSPQISWTGAPEGTQSFVVEVHDPDAPTGVGWFHWVAVDLPASTTSLPFDASATGLPAPAIQSRTDFGGTAWGGPCPPPGAPHRYVFTVYAVDVPSLGIDASAVPAVVRFMLRGHTLALGRTIATYGRPE